MRVAFDTYRYTRVAARSPGSFAIFQAPGTNKPDQAWEIAGDEAGVIAHAEVFEGKDQWGVRLFDEAPHLDESDLLKLVGHLLVWHAGARVETVEVVLVRSKSTHVLVRVGGDYV